MLGIRNYGRLGNGGTSDKTTPTLTSSLGTGRTAVALSSGDHHTCAILDNGAVSCWGAGSVGGLGNGGTSDKSTPTLTSSLGTGRTALLIDGDKDGDGVSDHFDSYPGDSIRSIKCDTGQFGRYQCVDAPLGKFVPSSGSMYATDASPGYFVSSAGQSSATACSPGYYQASSGQTSCDAADAGYYVSGTAQTSQTACAAGTYNPSTGSSSSSACADADAGYYVPTSGQASQTACAAGTYQASTGQSSCDDADAGIMFPSSQPKRARLLVLQEPIKQAQVNPRVMLLMQATMFLAPANRARPLVLLEPLAARQDRARVLTLQQDILCHLLVSRVRLHAVLDTIKHPPVKHPVMLLMQATMFLAQPKRARLLVLLEPLASRQDPRQTLGVEIAVMQDICDCMHPGQQASSRQTSCDAADAVLAQTIKHPPEPIKQTSCDDADAGYYVSGTAQTSQTACAAGTYQASTGQSSSVTMPIRQDILCHLLVKRADCLFCRTIKHHLVKPPVMLLMQATMFLAQPKRARLLVLREPIKQAQDNPRVTMLTLDCILRPMPDRLYVGTYNPSTGSSSSSACADADAGYQASQTACAVGTYQSKHRSILV